MLGCTFGTGLLDYFWHLKDKLLSEAHFERVVGLNADRTAVQCMQYGPPSLSRALRRTCAITHARTVFLVCFF